MLALFNEYEGLDDLVRVCAKLSNHGLDFSLLLVGSSNTIKQNEGPNECPESLKLKRLAQEFGFTKNLYMTGRVSPELLADYYEMINLIVIPRKPLPVCELVSPVKPMEALAMGKVVLMSDVKPLREIAEESKAALLFKAGDIDDCEKCIKTILRDETKYSELKHKARQWIGTKRIWHFTTQTIHNAVLSVMTQKQYDQKQILIRYKNKIFTSKTKKQLWKNKKLAIGESISIGDSVKAGDILLVKFKGTDTESPSSKGIVADVRYSDEAGNILTGPFSDLNKSQKYPAYFYIKTDKPEKASVTYRTLVVPEKASKIKIKFVCHLCEGTVRLSFKPSVQVMNLTIINQLLETAADNSDWMPAAANLAQSQGSCFLLKRVLEKWIKASGGAPEIVQKWAAVNAELIELEPDWYPRLYVKASAPTYNNQYSICHLHKTAYPFENTGGAIRCLNILKSQQAIGLDPYLITPPGYPKSGGVEGVPTTERIEGIEHFRIGPNTSGIKTLSLSSRTRFAAVQSARIIKNRGALLIHAASGVRGYELALQAFALRDVFDIPVIYEVRSFHEHTWTQAKKGIFDLERTQLRIRKENRCMELADHIVTISNSMRDVLIKRGVPSRKIDVIPNAIDELRYIDLNIAPIAHEALRGAELVVGYISNMSLREGHQFLLRAVAQLRSTGIDARCLLVGNGPERKSLESLANQLNILDITAFVGEVDHSIINSYYLSIDVFVVPRIPDYAADWVTLLKPYEAMALSRPLVVTDLPALREVIGDGKRGRIAKPVISDSLCEEILATVKNPDSTTAITIEAKKWVFENRTWASNAKRYRDIYDRVLSKYKKRCCRTGKWKEYTEYFNLPN